MAAALCSVFLPGVAAAGSKQDDDDDDEDGHRGRAVQVGSIKPTLKAPGNKRLKLNYG